MDRIFVTVRAKPISPDDAKSSPWRISGNSISLLNYPSKFDFDRVFGEDCRTREVYDVRTKEIVASAVRGFNGTVFAYGQTSSGKTYTMRGLAGEPGIIPLAIHDLFQSIQEHTDREFLVRVSYMEIYNEEINDLLAPEHRKLQIHESIERGIFVAGLKEEIVTCPEQVLDLMEFGESHRHIGETNMNFHSSRSHTIFRMIIESRDRRDDDDSESCDAIRVSILNLVDLAGSERVVKTGAEGMRLKEGSHINKSLLTLGTVIKKLSEGVESQGGHVPYRDSKLTRILQSALGGNANTAIICNITLAQIHTDETKSTLQFASRALRVTNCAHVNEILTDAALLKRQKKEIEELRARLQGSHMEHWEEEILNLRNTLLQSELEKERITLELEEEKKDKAQREKRLNEKIANLSSMFLYSKRDGDAFLNQEKRRNTWCPGASLDKPANTDFTIGTSMVQESHDAEKSENGASFQPSFEELLEENVKQDIHTLPCLDSKHDPGDTLSPDNFCFLDKHALMHVTNRRKAQRRNTSSPVRAEMDVLFEAKEKLFENPSTVEGSNSALSQTDTIFYCGSTVKTCIESELSLGFSQLCNQKTLLVPEKASQQKNFDGTFKDTQVANFEENMDKVWQSLGMESELHLTMDTVSSMSLIVDETIQDFLMLSKFFMELRASTTQDVQQLKSIIQGHDQIYHCMLSKADDLETEKSFLLERSVESSRIIDGLKLELESCKEMLDGKVSEYDLEKEDLLRQILELQREVTHLSSSSLARENEGLRKDLEKTRTKLKETDSKFKNAVQEKSRLEAEKAHNEREIKHLIGQRALLERDISRRESLIEKKNDVRPSDFNKVKGHIGPSEHVVQMECQRLELHVSELESTIMALEEQYLLVVEEKEELFSRQSTLDDELEAATDKLNAANIALENLQEENLKSQQYESRCKELEYLTEMMLREKEEMGIQLTDALLELEAEKSTRLCAEKDLTDGRGKIVLLEESIATLTTNLAQQAKMEFEAYNQECHILREKLSLSEDHLEQERQQRTAEIARLRSHIAQVQINNSKNEEALEEKYRILLLDISRLQADINVLSGERDMLSLQLNEKNMAYSPTVFEDALRSKENLKLRMRLHSTQEKLDMCRGRYKEVSRDMSVMHKKYEEASANLKKQLADYGTVILQLKKELQLGGGCSRNC